MLDLSPRVVQKKPVAVLYGGSFEPARVVAEHMGQEFRRRGFLVEVRPFRHAKGVELGRFAAAAMALPLPMGGEEGHILKLIRAQKESLDRIPTALITMSAGQSNAEKTPKSAKPNAAARKEGAHFVADTRALLDRFSSETGWRPTRHWPVAGSITYVHYNFIVRHILKFLAKGMVDPPGRRDDWQALEAFLDEFEAEIHSAGFEGSTGSGPAAD